VSNKQHASNLVFLTLCKDALEKGVRLDRKDVRLCKIKTRLEGLKKKRCGIEQNRYEIG